METFWRVLKNATNVNALGSVLTELVPKHAFLFKDCLILKSKSCVLKKDLSGKDPYGTQYIERMARANENAPPTVFLGDAEAGPRAAIRDKLLKVIF